MSTELNAEQLATVRQWWDCYKIAEIGGEPVLYVDYGVFPPFATLHKLLYHARNPDDSWTSLYPSQLRHLLIYSALFATYNGIASFTLNNQGRLELDAKGVMVASVTTGNVEESENAFTANVRHLYDTWNSDGHQYNKFYDSMEHELTSIYQIIQEILWKAT